MGSSWAADLAGSSPTSVIGPPQANRGGSKRLATTGASDRSIDFSKKNRTELVALPGQGQVGEIKLFLLRLILAAGGHVQGESVLQSQPDLPGSKRSEINSEG